MNRNNVEDVLFVIGIPANHRGFDYIMDAMEVIEKEGCTVSATKVLYPAIAKMHKTTANGVERAIRYTLKCARENGNQEVFEKYIGHINTNNGAALTSLYKRINREEEEEKAEMAKQIVEIRPELESVIRKVVREELLRMAAG